MLWLSFSLCRILLLCLSAFSFILRLTTERLLLWWWALHTYRLTIFQENVCTIYVYVYTNEPSLFSLLHLIVFRYNEQVVCTYTIPTQIEPLKIVDHKSIIFYWLLFFLCLSFFLFFEWISKSLALARYHIGCWPWSPQQHWNTAVKFKIVFDPWDV